MKIRYRYQLSIGILFILAGLMFGYGPFKQYLETRSLKDYSQNQPPVSAPVTPQVNPIAGKPARIEVPSLGIDLQVINGYYNSGDQSWTLTNDKAQYATMTPQANNISGNTFIYAHRLPGVFANLANIKPGEMVKIHTENGHMFEYTFRSAYETSPTDSSLFQYQGPPILTLQTCSGLWDQNRTLFTFDLVRGA